MLNLEYMSLETAADVVVYMAGRPEYQPTPVSDHLLDALALSRWVRASLAVHGIELHMRAEGGIVWVTGHGDSSELRKQIIAIAQAVPRATQVITEV